MPFTPGQWTIRRNKDGKAEAIGREGYPPHACLCIPLSEGQGAAEASEELEANAILIALAPLLLAACEQFKMAFDRGEQHCGSVRWEDLEDAYGIVCEALRAVAGNA